MREYVGLVSKIFGETFTLTYVGQNGEKQLTAKVLPPDAAKRIMVGNRVKLTGDWAGTLGAGAMTTFTAREIEILG